MVDDPGTPADENGPLDGPAGVLFGEDGDLYVGSFNTNQVLRYDGSTGAYLGVFVSGLSGGLFGPDAGMAWGPDGHLYVPSFFNHRVLKYDQKTGASLGTFIPSGLGGLNNPRTIVFRSDGTVLVSAQGTNQVLHYAADGSFLGPFLSPKFNNVTGLAVSPLDGNLYASNLNADNVRRFNGTNGTWMGAAVTSGAGGLNAPVFLAFHQNPYLRLSRFSPGTTNTLNQIEVTGASPFEVQVWLIGASLGSFQLPGCPHLFLGIQNPLLRFKLSNGTGTSSVSANVGDDLLGVTIALQVLELASCRVTNLVVQTFEQG